MRILTKEELLKAPPGTVYSPYLPDVIDGKIHIKVDNTCNLEIIPNHEWGDINDTYRATNWATDDLSIQADYDANDLFAVFNKAEIMKMIDCLAWALSGCDAPFNMDEVFYPSGIIVNYPDWMPDT